jgi:hypothetical protein
MGLVNPSDFHHSSQSLCLLDPIVIKKLGDDHSALKNSNAIHGPSLFPAEERKTAGKLSDQKVVSPIGVAVDLLLPDFCLAIKEGIHGEVLRHQHFTRYRPDQASL